MRKILFAVLMLAAYCGSVYAEEYIENTPEQIFDVQLSAADILKKAELCIISDVKNDSVMLVGTSTGYTGLFDPSGKRSEALTTIPASEVIKYKDALSGVIYANSRIDVKANLITFSVQSVIDFAAKDNKFKISHKDILFLQKNVGYGTPDSYKKMPKKDQWMSHRNENTLKALDGLVQKISTCIQATPNTNW